MAHPTPLLTAAAPEPHSSEDLFALVYDELRRLAARRIGRPGAGATLQATALVHEAFLRLRGTAGVAWENRAHFFGAAAQAMRRILIENARRKSAWKRGGHLIQVDVDTMDLPDRSPDEKLLLIHEALQRLEIEDPDKANIVALKFFGGLCNHEVAACLGITERTVERNWAYARAWLFECIREIRGTPAAS
ncbi:MAG TPA: ECF-type sigma factor [Opitutaceae bacterium]|jgi:RNA polymerase sigma factor (TIGR02999 family)